MEKYENLGLVGEGSYGIVMKCRHKESGQLVAVKKFIESEDDKMVKKIALREVRMLKQLHHENLVNLLDVFRRKRRLFLVFEFVDHTILEELERNPMGLDELSCKKCVWQVLRGIDFCHSHNIIHRDVKPENVLVSRTGVVKLCDFGFARTLAGPGEAYTDYVATRWYRAPELLVGDTNYGKAVDVWAIGCLLGEMLTGEPLFPGDSDIDQLYHITKCFGNLIHHHREIFMKNPLFVGLRLPDMKVAIGLGRKFPRLSPQSHAIIKKCLRMEPSERPLCCDLLSDDFFRRDGFIQKIVPELKARIRREIEENPLLANLGLKLSDDHYETAPAPPPVVSSHFSTPLSPVSHAAPPVSIATTSSAVGASDVIAVSHKAEKHTDSEGTLSPPNAVVTDEKPKKKKPKKEVIKVKPMKEIKDSKQKSEKHCKKVSEPLLPKTEVQASKPSATVAPTVKMTSPVGMGMKSVLSTKPVTHITPTFTTTSVQPSHGHYSMAGGAALASSGRSHHFDSTSEEKQSTYVGMEALHVTNSVSVTTLGMSQQADSKSTMVSQPMTSTGDNSRSKPATVIGAPLNAREQLMTRTTTFKMQTPSNSKKLKAGKEKRHRHHQLQDTTHQVTLPHLDENARRSNPQLITTQVSHSHGKKSHSFMPQLPMTDTLKSSAPLTSQIPSRADSRTGI